MTGRSKLILSLLSVLALFIVLQIIFYMNHKNSVRQNTSLLNQYYMLRDKDPMAARRALEIILKDDPTNTIATRELAWWYLRSGDINDALPQFKKAHQLDPNNAEIAAEYARLSAAVGNHPIITPVAEKPVNPGEKTAGPLSPPPVSLVSAVSYARYLAPVPTNMTLIPHHQATAEKTIVKVATVANQTPISGRDQMLNTFYDLKKKNSPLAFDVIRHGATLYPDDVQVLKEAGYYALLTLKDNKLALGYFNRVYLLTADPQIALQVAYLYDGLGQSRVAYHYFDQATHTTNKEDRMAAELAKSNLRGVQTKFLPYPYEATLDYSPLYMSRFKLMIQPVIFHLGLTLNQPYNWKVYLSYRRTTDDQSHTTNLISNIYEDDAAITAIGTQLTPIKSIPQLVFFSELGKAVDLVYRDRSRWRTDFRGGVAYYNEWGFKPDYTLKPTFMLKPNADFYSDLIYFTRYIDTIGTARFRPGVKVFRWGSTSVDIYYKMFLIEDYARQFYNNTFERGPGIDLRFSDRYNIVLRYEQIAGHYLPAGSPTPNPYSPRYHNTITELDTFFTF